LHIIIVFLILFAFNFQKSDTAFLDCVQFSDYQVCSFSQFTQAKNESSINHYVPRAEYNCNELINLSAEKNHTLVFLGVVKYY